MKKHIEEISWRVSEPEYRQDPALSYSTLSRYEREGFEKLDSLFTPVETPALTFGSAVDCLLTDGEEEFNKSYLVLDIPAVEPAIEPIVKEVFRLYGTQFTDLHSIPDTPLMSIIDSFQYQQRWRPETRCKVVREKGQAYYHALFRAGSKTILTQELYAKVFACVSALRDSKQTKSYFEKDNPFGNIEHCYQPKFKALLGNVEYRCMADLLIVDHDKKTVHPVDLKTSSKLEYEFPKSFLEWRYDLQARLYWRIIRANMDKDSYFKDFKLLDYTFVVVSKQSNPITPLVWSFDKTQALGELSLGGKTLRDPQIIGEELTYYLKEKPLVPNGVTIYGTNSITQWFDKK